MTKDNEEALQCADYLSKPLKEGAALWILASNSAAHLRRLVAESEAKDALLRQAVEALERATTGWHRDGQPRLSVDMDALPVADAALSAIRQHLKKST